MKASVLSDLVEHLTDHKQDGITAAYVHIDDISDIQFELASKAHSHEVECVTVPEGAVMVLLGVPIYPHGPAWPAYEGPRGTWMLRRPPPERAR